MQSALPAGFIILTLTLEVLVRPKPASFPWTIVSGVYHPPTNKVKVKVTQLRLTLCDPMDYTIHGILQARILEWVAFPFSRGSSQPRD